MNNFTVNAEKKPHPNKTHGATKTRLYQTWMNMRRRCYDPKQKAYKNYGARGIKVCDEWMHSFVA